MSKSVYEKITKKYYKEMLTSLNEFVAIKSVYDETTVSEENPFGKGVSNALNYFATLASKDGFKVTNYDNKVVEAIIGEGSKNITIMAHADVVPEGTGWEGDPYKIVENKDTLIARGVADDKGPALAAYYALKALKEHNMLGKYQVRFLLGGNEERGSLCMEHYFETLKKPQPTYGFSPDSNFPLIYAEKAIFGFDVKKRHKMSKVISIHGGEVSNAVIEECVVRFELDNDIVPYLTKNYPDASILTRDDIVTVTFKGVGAHGSVPQLGKNAAFIALNAIYGYTGDKIAKEIVDRYSDPYGKGINAYTESKDMGKNSCNVGIFSYENGIIHFVVNFRYVNGVKYDSLESRIRKSNLGYDLKFYGPSKLLYIPKTSPLVKTLLHAYQEETGDKESKPLAVGGGTYAKEADNVVAFGMEFPGYDCKMHTVGEQIEKSFLYKGMAIYARAIVELGNLTKISKKSPIL